jgi:hypothetical protein
MVWTEPTVTVPDKISTSTVMPGAEQSPLTVTAVLPTFWWAVGLVICTYSRFAIGHSPVE